MRIVPRLLLGLLLGAIPSIAHASAGGEVLPFNDTFSLIQSNLSGPTANTIAFIVAFGGVVAIGLSKQSEILKPIGTTLLVVVLIAKLPAVLGAIGLTGATGAMVPFYVPLIPSAVLAVIALALYFAPDNGATGVRQL
jgi:hypothetical protein